jgi:hypothetical protein
MALRKMDVPTRRAFLSVVATFGKGHLKSIRVHKDFRHHALWFLENLAHIWAISTRLGLVSRVHMKGSLATTPSKARIALGARID